MMSWVTNAFPTRSTEQQVIVLSGSLVRIAMLNMRQLPGDFVSSLSATEGQLVQHREELASNLLAGSNYRYALQ